MSMIFQEKFEIGPETQQMNVGVSPFQFPCMEALTHYDLLLVGFSEARGAFQIERSGAPFHILLIGVEGQGEIIDGERRLILEPNQLGILPAHSVRGFRRLSEHWRVAWFLLDDVPRWAQFAGDEATVRSVLHAHSLFYALHALCYEARIGITSHSGSALVLVMDLLQRMLSNAVSSDELPNRLRQLFDSILYEPAQGWRVDVLAQQFGVSATHFQRLCLKHLGVSPQQLIIQLRMQRASDLLATGRYRVSEVARMVGYEEVASFSRRFRSHFGLSPSQLTESMPQFAL